MEHALPRIAFTHGDTNGIGYELIFRLFEEPEMFEICTPIVYGAPKVANYHRKAIRTSATYHIIQSLDEAQDGKLNILPCIDDEVKVEFGRASKESGEAALISLEAATADVLAGKVDALVTAPVNKHCIGLNSEPAASEEPSNATGEESLAPQPKPFTGHTEFLAERTGADDVLMLMSAEQIRVAVATTHLPLKDVAASLTQEVVESKIRLLHGSLLRDFGVSDPRIAVLALNPHAGDGGLLGSEESDVLTPVITRLAEGGMNVLGPYPADAFFGGGCWRQFDAVLAMYHDQGLIPFKTIAGTRGVNFTAGLPIVRTSPDHGVAYDIAGRGQADPQSMREAVYQAIDIVRRRQAFDEANCNPLPKLFHERKENDRLNFN